MTREQIVDLILTDRMDEAARALGPVRDIPPVFDRLMREARPRPRPLDSMTAEPPPYVVINPSYTCKIKCKMCVTGFHDRSELFENYKYVLPEEFETMRPWIRQGSHVLFVGLGETLDSPHLIDHLRSIDDRVVVVTTSGVPLNREKIRQLLEAGVDILNFSLDGKTSVGHGDGRDTYNRNIWKKIDLVRQMKEELGVERPELGLEIVVNRENLDDLDNMLTQAQTRGVRDVMLSLMQVKHNSGRVDPDLYARSLGMDFEKSRERINRLIRRWSGRGLRIHMQTQPGLQPEYPVCLYIDNYLGLQGFNDRPTLCCGTLELPVAQGELSPREFWNTFPLRYIRYLHFAGTAEQLPAECRTCSVMHPERYYQECGRALKPKTPPFNPYPVYQEASRLKREGKRDDAARRFRELFEAPVADELKGKAAYHLAEMRAETGDYEEALAWAERCVQHNFRHRMGWVLVYLLMRATETPRPAGRREKFNIAYHPRVRGKLPLKVRV